MSQVAEKYNNEFSLKDMLYISWDIYISNYKDIFKLSVIVYLPLSIFLTFYPIGNLLHYDSSDAIGWFTKFSSMNFAIYLSFFGNISLAILLKHILFCDKYAIRSVLIESLKKLFSNIKINSLMLGTIFVCFNLWMYFSIITPTIFVLLLIPIVYYLVNWSFSIYVFSFEDSNLYISMKKSYNVVNKRWGKVFYRILSLIFLSYMTSLTLGLPYSFLQDTLIMRAIYTTLINVITTYFVIVFIVFYLNFNETTV